MDNAEDARLVARAKENPKEFDVLYRKYYEKVYSYFLFRTGYDKQVSEDLMQDVFFRAFRQLKNYKDRGFSYLTYLLSIAHNLLVNFYSKPKHSRLEEHHEIPRDLLREVEDTSDVESVWREAAKLPRSEREAVLLRFRDSRTIREISLILGISENAAKLAISRARKKVRMAFGRLQNPVIRKRYTKIDFVKKS